MTIIEAPGGVDASADTVEDREPPGPAPEDPATAEHPDGPTAAVDAPAAAGPVETSSLNGAAGHDTPVDAAGAPAPDAPAGPDGSGDGVSWDGFAAARTGVDGEPPAQAATHHDGVDPAYAVDFGRMPDPEAPADPADDRLTDAAYLVEETGPIPPDAPGSLAAVVAEHLAAPPPDGQLPDGRVDSAQAVLDVLRASGWSDTTETAGLRAEVERLRELLDLVVRDHRARMATAADGQHEQAHWLVPLLRAAHGVAFGTLGAKVHLRTAVHDVPPAVLASAGLRIDDPVEPAHHHP